MLIHELNAIVFMKNFADDLGRSVSHQVIQKRIFIFSFILLIFSAEN